MKGVDKLDPKDKPCTSQPLQKYMISPDELTKRRSFAKKNFSLNHNKLLPLVQLSGTEACESIQDVKELMLKVENCYNVFVKAHDSYVGALEDVTLEKDAENVGT